MSLKNLLPLSPSFTQNEERPGRYRPTDPGVLPRFGEGRGRGRGRGEDETTGAIEAGRTGVALRREGSGTKGRGGCRLPLWVEQWVLALVRPGNRRRGTRVVQSEMDFRSVKVVRNDLATADVEVVVKGEKGQRALSAACRGRLWRLWWDQGVRRIRRIGNALF